MANSWQALFFVVILALSVNQYSFGDAPVPTGKWIPPRQQVSKDVNPVDVICNDGLILMLKTSDGAPACVKPSTAQKLVERGWGMLKDKLVWFEFEPIQCQSTPWDQYGATHLTAMPTEGELIKMYFSEEQRITILDIKGSFKITENSIPCGKPSGNTYYFLVSESDSYKMTKLTYERTTTFLANTRPVQ